MDIDQVKDALLLQYGIKISDNDPLLILLVTNEVIQSELLSQYQHQADQYKADLGQLLTSNVSVFDTGLKQLLSKTTSNQAALVEKWAQALQDNQQNIAQQLKNLKVIVQQTNSHKGTLQVFVILAGIFAVLAWLALIIAQI